jgi:membrane protein insertase Oxa1/YidC/SpoIIIJ/rhodanese-related sulfurtransferase/phosphohistidine swiveling domain-containing protein
MKKLAGHLEPEHVAFSFALVLSTTPLWAIPSPDLVVNFVASAAQVLGLASVVLGGVAVSSRRRARAGGQAGSPWPFRIVLGLFLISIAANVFQYAAGVDERNQRLSRNLWRSSTEGGKKVGDVNLKTTSFSEQETLPQGMTTEQVARAIEEGRGLNIIDVREPEEVEMGHIKGSWHRRYPDLKVDRRDLIVEGKETVLICESGNRSCELMKEFLPDDIQCRFMIGGYEKWVAEGRPLDNEVPRTGEIRDIPDYPNKWTLLDTPDVMKLVKEREVLFVDVRYPGEFDQAHLPGAVNLTMRRMLKDELEAALSSLEKKPIIVPCYDKRSSFYAMILGLRLHRLGHEFLGRYTVPHEFVAETKEKDFVLQWKENQKGKTLLGMASRPLDGILAWLTGATGHLALGIALLVVLLRAIILPWTVKAERDQVVQAKVSPEVKALKARIGGDPKRFARAVMAIHRRERLTPGRNLVATIIQILLFLVCFSVVNRAAEGSEQGFLWIESLGEPDPWYILPLVTGILIFAHLLLATARRSWWLVAVHAAFGAFIFVLTFQLKAAVALYLALNIALLFIQSRLTRMYLRRDRARWKAREDAGDPGIVPLTRAHRVRGTGNKAARLGRLLEEGLPVAKGFVVTESLLRRQDEKLDLSRRERGKISQAWRRLQTTSVAVRSSGLNEDGSDKSYAGVFESCLDVRFDKLMSALDEVYGSMRSERAAAYSGSGNETGAVLIQKMVDAEYAGVVFTEHPSSAGAMLVEMVRGLGEKLVSGQVTPHTYRYGRVTGRCLERAPPPIDLDPLIDLARRVERIFGRPQDIEWAVTRGRFYLLQSRDITRSSTDGGGERAFLERERKRLLDLALRGAAAAPIPREEPLFVQTELSELLPRPTPMSLSLMESLWAAGGSTDIASRELGLPYRVEEDSPPLVNTVFGALYVNKVEEKRRVGRGPGALAAFRLGRIAEALERELREEVLPALVQDARLNESIDPARLRLQELTSLFRKWTERFVKSTYVEAEKINLAAGFYVRAASRDLERRGLDIARHLGHIPETVVHRAMALLSAMRGGEAGAGDQFLDLFGHRSPNDYELAQPRYREDAALVEELVSRAGSPVDAGGLAPPEAIGDRLLALTVERARRYQALKEEAKHHALRELALIRVLAVELGGRLGVGDGIFYLTIDEVPRLEEEDFARTAPGLISERMAAARAFEGVRLPTRISLGDLETLSTDGHVELAARPAPGALRGTRVSGDREPAGRVRVVQGPEDIRSFQKGEILVARFTDPTWTPLFPIAAGVVTEVGGWLSHAAIVAREYNVPGIVGAEGALSALATGDLVRLRSDGTIERVTAERRGDDRFPVEDRTSLTSGTRVIDVLLRNVSRTGALVEAEGDLEAGQAVSIRIDGDGDVEAEVLRRDGASGYALRFRTPLVRFTLPEGAGPLESPTRRN